VTPGTGAPGPPPLSEKLLALLLPPGDREAILGDLAEEHRARARRDGKGAADRWYRWEVLRAALPALRSRLPRPIAAGASRRGGRAREGIGAAVLRDLAHALRMLRRGPGFAAVVLVTLAVGIGATTAVFSVVDGVLLRPLPYPDAERILHLWERPPRGGRSWVSAPNFRDWRQGLESFEEIAALSPSGFNVSGEGGPERTEGVEVTPGFFRVLGAELALGRGFLAGEGGGRSSRVVVISHGLWRRQFGGSPDALGRTLTLEGTPYEVVGVLAPGAGYPSGREVWVPVDLISADWKRNRGTKWLMVVGRLGEGVSPRAARAEMDALSRALADEHPESNEGTAIATASLRDEMVGDVRIPLLVLLGAVALVLLVVSVSLAGLWLARGARRRREVAIRRSLGGSPGRIVRQLMTEGLVFSLAGGALGLIGARWGLLGLVALAPPGVPRLQEASLDGRVLLVGLVLSVVTGLVAGLAPALGEAGVDPREGLGGRVAGGRRGPGGSRGLLVVAQVALAVVLVVGAGHLLLTLRNLRGVDPGFDPRGVVTAYLPLTEARYGSDAEIAGFYGELLRRVRALPDVESAGVVWTLPLSGRMAGYSFELRNPGDLDPRELQAGYQPASAGYFETVGIPLIRGRAFREGEGPEDEPVVIVDEAFARRFFPGRDPLGRQILAVGEEWRRVVGVVGSVRRRGLQGEPEPQYYVPLGQDPRDAMDLVVRAAGSEPGRLVPAIRRIVGEIDPAQPVVAAGPFSDLVGRSVARSRFLATTVTVFGGVTLLLAALGIYGVVAQLVEGRTREIGIRIALGATGASVRGMVVVRGLVLALVGLGVGLLGAVPALRLVRGVLFQVSTFEIEIALGVAALLGAASVLASFLPAVRATRVDPVRALGRE